MAGHVFSAGWLTSLSELDEEEEGLDLRLLLLLDFLRPPDVELLRLRLGITSVVSSLMDVELLSVVSEELDEEELEEELEELSRVFLDFFECPRPDILCKNEKYV